MRDKKKRMFNLIFLAVVFLLTLAGVFRGESLSDLIRTVAEGRQAGEEPGYLAWLFHRELAEMIAAACVEIRRQT